MISVVVPVYNVADYLDDCLSSILNSTYEDIEVLVIDDGSTDGSSKICDKYASLDVRCRVIHTANGGLSTARNRGISEAKSEFIGFVDGDDFIHPKMYEYLYQALCDFPDADFSFCDYTRASKGKDNQIKPCRSYDIVQKRIFDQQGYVERLFGTSSNNDFMFMAVWNKLYRRSTIADTRFRESGAEDIDFNVQVLPRVQKIVFVEERLDYWVQRPTSFLHQGLTNKYIDRVDVYDQMCKQLNSIHPNYSNYCIEKFCKINLHIRRISKGTDKEEYAATKLKPYMNQYAKKLLFCSSIPLYRRLVMLIFNYCPFLYSRYISLMDHR